MIVLMENRVREGKMSDSSVSSDSSVLRRLSRYVRFRRICPDTSGMSELVEFSAAGPIPAAVFKHPSSCF